MILGMDRLFPSVGAMMMVDMVVYEKGERELHGQWASWMTRQCLMSRTSVNWVEIIVTSPQRPLTMITLQSTLQAFHAYR